MRIVLLVVLVVAGVANSQDLGPSGGTPKVAVIETLPSPRLVSLSSPACEGSCAISVRVRLANSSCTPIRNILRHIFCCK